MTETDRRRHVRAAVSLIGAVESGAGETPVVLVDLSTGGARLQMDDPPDPEQSYELHFTVRQREYHAPFRAVRWAAEDGAYHWGCSFLGMATEQIASLRGVVHAAAGLAQTSLRPWEEVLPEATRQPEANVLVGQTPAGEDIRLLGQDCLEAGQDGVELFVRTVAGLEQA